MRGHLNDMTEEEIKALQDAKEAAEQKVAEAEAIAQAARAEADKAKTDLVGVVDELKLERQKKNEALNKAPIINNETDVNSLVEMAIQKKEDERRKAETESAIAEFKSSKTEFQNDSAGLVFAKFQSELSKHNLSNLSTKEQVKNRLEEIYRFVNFKANDENNPEYDGSPKGGYHVGDVSNKPGLETEALLTSAKMDKEKYTTLKNKYPEALTGLGIN